MSPWWLWVCFAVQGGAVLASGTPLICLHGTSMLPGGSVLPNGTLLSPGGHLYPKSTWRGLTDGRFEVCKCTARPCVRMCCSGQQVVDSTHFTKCRKPSGELEQSIARRSPAVYDKDNLTPIIANDSDLFYKNFDVIYSVPNCSHQRFFAEPEDMENFYLLSSGKLMSWGGELFHDVFTYCFVPIVDLGELLPVLCEEDTSVEGEKKVRITSVCMLVSAPFLAVTFVVYAILPALQTTHGCSLMSHVLALLVGFVCLPTANLFYYHITREVCMSFAFIIYFAFLASFFWLNVMCLDIWWTFSGFRPMRGSVKEREHKKFIIYSLYCWGSPLIMLIICMIMELLPGIPDSIEKPGFGVLKCWFKSRLGNFIYFIGPTAILIVCNIVLFILTAVKIRQVKRGTKILKKQDSRRHNEDEENNTQRFNLYLKLFLVMGVNWIMEIVSFAAGGPDEYWYISDIANTLQGVLIFIIFVWKDRIRKLLLERFCPSRAVNTNSLAISSSTRTTGIRHNGSVMSSGRPSIKKSKDELQMKTLTSIRSDDSDVA